MADIVQSLFGLTPEALQQQRAAEADKMALEYAQLTPIQQAQFSIGRGAYQLAGALGGEDPQLRMISTRNAIAKQIDYTNPESMTAGIRALSQAGDTVGAMQLSDVLRKMQSEMALRGQREAQTQESRAQTIKAEEETRRIRLSAEQREELQRQLNALGPEATDEQVLGVLRKYGDPEKILGALQAKETRQENLAFREAQAQQQRDFQAQQAEAARLSREQQAEANRQQQLQMAVDRNQAMIDAAKERGATQLQIAQMQIESRRQLAVLAASLKGPKALPAGLQKEEDKDLELIDNFEARKETLAPAIQALTPDPKTNKPFLELGPLANARYLAQNVAGNSTDQSRAFANLQRAVQEATNLKTDAAKGVQTDKDVLRFANELIAAFGKYDTKTTLDALTNFRTATEKAQDRTRTRLESRRQSQGVDPYFGATRPRPPAPSQVTPSVAIPQQAIDYLRQNPNLKADFDKKYGAGQADRVLGGK